MTKTTSAWDTARQIADAVLFEGYMLYPYRANDAKNRVRWQFGVLVPPGYAAADPSERSWLQTECLVEGRNATVTVRARFLQVQPRTVLAADGRPVDVLDTEDVSYLPWEEAVLQEVELELPLPGDGDAQVRRVVSVDGGSDIEPVADRAGRVVGQLVRRRRPLTALISCRAESLPGPYGVRRLRMRLENSTDWAAVESGSARPDALQSSLVAAHLMVGVSGGAFISAIDPPEWASGYVADCQQVGSFPVLAGPAGDRGLMLCSPIILYDHPQLAPESQSEFCDGLEMDELLTLRTQTLTEAEKRQARGSDPRAAALLDQVDHLPPELMDRLHGAIRSMTAVARPTAAQVAPSGWRDSDDRDSEVRDFDDAARPPWWDPAQDASVDPDTDVVLIGGVPVGRGTPVRLHPGRGTAAHRTDAQDMFLAGHTGTVQAVLLDVEGGTHIAVSLDDLDDGEYYRHGRFLYFAPDELSPIGATL